jgi:hypothetical protein
MEFWARNILNSLSGRVSLGGAGEHLDCVGGPHEFGGWPEVCFWERDTKVHLAV